MWKPFLFRHVIFTHRDQTQTGAPAAQTPSLLVGCRAAERYIRHLLWESINDGETRQCFIADLEYCPEHTHMLAFQKKERHGDALGVNIMYENFVNVIEGRLETWGLPQKGRKGTNHLAAASACRVFHAAGESVKYAFKTLLEELETSPDEWQRRVSTSGGLCLAHLRQGLNSAKSYPTSASFLRQDAHSRLKRWQEGLKGYIRKHRWELREEALTENESRAWREVLDFFTGQPPDSFER